jgi:hypothetical protein
VISTGVVASLQLAMELIRNDQIGTRPRIVSGKQETRVGDRDGIAMTDV